MNTKHHFTFSLRRHTNFEFISSWLNSDISSWKCFSSDSLDFGQLFNYYIFEEIGPVILNDAATSVIKS